MATMIETTRRGMILANVRRARGGLTHVGVAFSPLVMAAQAALIAAGYDVGAEGADGKLGPHTTAAIKKYQKDHGLPVTGKVDDALMGSLGAVGEKAGEKIGESVGKGAGAGAARAVSAQIKSDTTTIMVVGGVVAAVVVGVAIWALTRKGV